MPTHRQIRAAIAANITAAQANTKVHLFERYLKELGTLKTEYVNATAGKLIGCHIRRVSSQRTAPGVGRWVILQRWTIRFYQALDDATQSELAFDDWIDAVGEVFRTDQTLGGLVFQTNPEDGQNTDGLQVDDSGPVMFCGVLSHSAKCTLFTTHLQ